MGLYVLIAIAVLISVFVIIYVRKNISQAKIAEAEIRAKRIIEDAEKGAESIKKKQF